MTASYYDLKDGAQQAAYGGSWQLPLSPQALYKRGFLASVRLDAQSDQLQGSGVRDVFQEATHLLAGWTSCESQLKKPPRGVRQLLVWAEGVYHSLLRRVTGKLPDGIQDLGV